MLVISHFDKDHVSGLVELAKPYNIKRIFLPYLENINVNLLSYALEILIRKNVISQSTKIILVNVFKGESIKSETNSKNNTLQKIITKDINNNDPFKKINRNENPKNEKPVLPSLFELESEATDSVSKLFDQEELAKFKIIELKKNQFQVFDWLFDFYNHPLPNDEIKSINSSFNTFVHRNKIKDFNDFINCKKLWKNFADSVYFNNIKKYKFMNDNNISLCMMHAPLRVLTCKDISATLLTGDLNLKKPEIYASFNTKYSYIKLKLKVLFIPHHGSRKNWNDKLVHYYCKNALSIITAASESKHDHPDFEVISKIFLSKNDVLCITEKFDSYKYIVK